MKVLIGTLNGPQRSARVLNLPEINPDRTDAGARAGCAASDLCWVDGPIER